MNSDERRIWQAIIAAKKRAKERAESALAVEVSRRAALIAEENQARGFALGASSRLVEHENKTAEFFANSVNVAPRAYVEYVFYRDTLAQEVTKTQNLANAAATKLNVQEGLVSEAQVALHRATNSLNSAQENFRKLAVKESRKQEDHVDEEIGEVFAARVRVNE